MPTNLNLTVKNGPNELKFGTYGPWVNTSQLHLSFLKNLILGPGRVSRDKIGLKTWRRPCGVKKSQILYMCTLGEYFGVLYSFFGKILFLGVC